MALIQNHIRGLNPWQRAALAVSALAALISLVLVIALVVSHLNDVANVESQARDSAAQTAIANANKINDALENMRTLAVQVAADLSSGALTAAELEPRLKEELDQNEQVSSVAVAYRPEFIPDEIRRQGRDRYAPFSIRNEDGEITILYVEDPVDYTAPDGSLTADGEVMRTDWYHVPLEREEVVWGEPYYGSVANKYWAGVGTPFYLPSGSDGEILAGVVDVSLELAGFQDLLSTVSVAGREASGYGFVLSRTGKFIVNPLDEMVATETSVSKFDSRLSIDRLEQMFPKDGAGKQLVVEHIDEASGQAEWVFFARVPTVDWWVGIVLDKQQFRSDEVDNRLRRQRIGIALAVMGLVFFGSVIAFGAYRGGSRGLWMASAVFSVLSISVIAYLWVINVTNESRQDDRNTMLVERATSQKVVSNVVREHTGFISIPTGIFVESVEFSSANNVTVTGYIWQKYPADLPEEIASIKPLPPQPGLSLTPGFILPEADSTSVNEVFRQVQADGDEVIGWDFRAVLRQQFDYAKYPFDQEDVWVRLWPKDFDQKVILTPDLSSYTSTDPKLKPGIELQDFVLEDWDITKSFFSYRNNLYRTDFGVDGVVRQDTIPDLYFNVGLKRRFINAFVSNLIPIIVVAFLLFAVLLTVKSREGGADLTGFSTSAVLSFSAALFFVVIVAHVNLRSSLAAQGIIYLELFHFLMYGAILSVAINSIMVASPTRGWVLRFRDNLIARLLYWPVITAVLLGFTLRAFM